MNIKLFTQVTNKKALSLGQFCLFLSGFFCTMPVFSLGGLSLYNYPLFLYLLITVCKGKLYFHKNVIYIYILLLSLLISGLASFLIVPNNWATYSIKLTLKLSIIMFLLLSVISDSDVIIDRNYFFKGLFFAACAHIIWIFLQQQFYTLFNIDLNYVLFGVVTHVQNGGLVLSGLSWERANPIIALIIGIILTDNKIIKLIFTIGILVTASRTGIGILVIIFFYDLLNKLLNNEFKFKFKFSIRKLALFLCILLLLVIVVSNKTIQNYFNYTLIRFQRLIIGGNDYTNSSSEIDGHILYYQWLIPTLKQLPFLQILFGCGTGISGWVYTTFYPKEVALQAMNGPWGLETDFVGLVLGNGIVGTFLYYYASLKLFFTQKNIKLKKITLAILVGTFMYSFLSTSLSILLMIFCLSTVMKGNLDESSYVMENLDNGKRS